LLWAEREEETEKERATFGANLRELRAAPRGMLNFFSVKSGIDADLNSLESVLRRAPIKGQAIDSVLEILVSQTQSEDKPQAHVLGTQFAQKILMLEAQANARREEVDWVKFAYSGWCQPIRDAFQDKGLLLIPAATQVNGKHWVLFEVCAGPSCSGGKVKIYESLCAGEEDNRQP
jgi:hypothetical protein